MKHSVFFIFADVAITFFSNSTALWDILDGLYIYHIILYNPNSNLSYYYFFFAELRETSCVGHGMQFILFFLSSSEYS